MEAIKSLETPLYDETSNSIVWLLIKLGPFIIL